VYVVKDPFNNISVISWRLVLLVEETIDKLCYTKLCRMHLARSGIRTHNISGDIH
jgi:hypothetical protein